MKARRVVIDTNVLISAALSANTAPARALHLTLEHGRLLFSRETFAELLISGDGDLLEIVMVQGLGIVTPAEAVEELRAWSQNPSVN